MKIFLQILLLFIFSPCFSQPTVLKPGDVSPDVKKIKVSGLSNFNQGAAIVNIGDKSTLIDNKGNFIITPGKINFYTNGRNIISILSYGCGIDKDLVFPQTGIFDGYTTVGVLVNAQGKILYTVPKDNFSSDENALKKKVGDPILISHNRVQASIALYLDHEFIFSDGTKASLKHWSYTALGTWSEGMMALRKSPSPTIIWGYLNKQGQVAIPFIYDDAEPFSEGMAAVAKYDELHQLKWGFVDKKGKLIIPLIYSNKPGPFSNGLALVTPKTITDISAAYIDKSGAMKIKFPVGGVVPIGAFNNGWLSLRESYSSDTRYMDTTGKFYTDAEFMKLLGLPDSVKLDMMRTAKPGQILLTNQKGDRVGSYNYTTHSFIPPVFCRLGYFDEKAGLAYAALLLGYNEKNGKYIYREGYINREGVFVVLKADDENGW